MEDFKEIDKVLDGMLKEETLKAFLNTSDQKVVDGIYKRWEDIERNWYNFPKTRFGHILCHFRLIPDLDTENRLWDIDEFKWLEEHNNGR